VVTILLDAGVRDVNAKDKRDMTALMWAAAKNSDPEVVKVLLSRADANVQDEKGLTALMYAAWKNSNPGVVKVLSGKADVNAQDEKGLTALMYAAWKNFNPEVVKILLDSGANVYAKDKNEHDALWYAEEGKNNQVRDIIKKRIDPIDYYIEKIISLIFNENKSTIENIKTMFKVFVIIIALCVLIKLIIKIIRI